MYFYQLRPLEKKLTWQRLFIAQVITRSLSFISINQSLSELNSTNVFPSSSDYHCGKRDLDGSYYPNDIALILLDWEATTSNYVRPICLYHPQQGDLSHHTQLFSAGFVVWLFFNINPVWLASRPTHQIEHLAYFHTSQAGVTAAWLLRDNLYPKSWTTSP